MSKSDRTIFIAGSREMSPKRILDLFNHYSKKGNILWGVYSESFIKEFEDQPQFKTLDSNLIKKFKDILSEKNNSLGRKLKILEYSQDNELDLFDSEKIEKAIFINGSWKIVFHRRPLFEKLNSKKISYSLKSPFVDENEAKEYSQKIDKPIQQFINGSMQQLNSKRNEESDPSTSLRSAQDDTKDIYFLDLADIIAKRSFDYTWQTGAVLVKDGKVILTGHNRILPYETFAMHHGSLREKNKSALNDLSSYDTMHAEMDIVSQALKNKLSTANCTLYTNLMPCPNCARVLAVSGIEKLVCRHRHFGDYAEKLFDSVGIKTTVAEQVEKN